MMRCLLGTTIVRRPRNTALCLHFSETDVYLELTAESAFTRRMRSIAHCETGWGWGRITAGRFACGGKSSSRSSVSAGNAVCEYDARDSCCRRMRTEQVASAATRRATDPNNGFSVGAPACAPKMITSAHHCSAKRKIVSAA